MSKFVAAIVAQVVVALLQYLMGRRDLESSIVNRLRAASESYAREAEKYLADHPLDPSGKPYRVRDEGGSGNGREVIIQTGASTVTGVHCRTCQCAVPDVDGKRADKG